MTGIIRRNVTMFFRDKASIFFSLLSVFIIIGLYALFLGDVWLSEMGDIPDAKNIMNNWIMAGLLGTAGITTTMGAFGIMVNDKVQKIIKDFNSSPISRAGLTAGNILSSCIIGFIMSIITFIVAEAYIVISGGDFLGIPELFMVLGLIVLSVLSSSALVFFIVSFFKSENAFATASTVLGTLIGFITGIYLPIGSLPEAVQWVVKLFPPSHAVVLFRQVMVERPIEASFANVPAEYINDFKTTFGVQFDFNGAVLEPIFSVLILVGSMILFYGLAVIKTSRKEK